MEKLAMFLFIIILASCKQGDSPKKEEAKAEETPNTIVTKNYELVVPEKQEGLLILFPCFPCDAINTKTEFNIADLAIENNITVLMMNFNNHLWLSDEEKKELETIIFEAAKTNKLDLSNTFIGGFSSGGNVSLLLTDYLKSTNSSIQPKGVFIVDSPIDLLALYVNAKKNIQKNFAKPAVQEANWIVEMFDKEFGKSDSTMTLYEEKSPYIFKTNSINNLTHLKDLKIRFYSEPDKIWWKENRLAEYEDMNAFYIEQLSKDLKVLYGNDAVQYVQTKNKGYRANGERHPHSWSIVDKKGLIDWMMEE